MDFDGDIGLWQRKIAESPEGEARRTAVYESLKIKSGQAILDIGCGGGHLIHKLGLATGETGRAVGLDVSEDQLNTAKALCKNISGTELIVGDATNMLFDDNSFDAVSSIQTLEYIDNVDLALDEIKRILKPGGKIALVSVLWDFWRFHGPDHDLNETMINTWKKHCPHQMLPMELSRKLNNVGFREIAQRPIAFINTTLNENAHAYWAAKVVAYFASANGVDQNHSDLWLEQLSRAEKEGRFGFASVPVLTTGMV